MTESKVTQRKELETVLEATGLTLNVLFNSYWQGKVPERKLNWSLSENPELFLDIFRKINTTDIEVYSAIVLPEDLLFLAHCRDEVFLGWTLHWCCSLSRENQNELQELQSWTLSSSGREEFSLETMFVSAEIVFASRLFATLRPLGFN